MKVSFAVHGVHDDPVGQILGRLAHVGLVGIDLERVLVEGHVLAGALQDRVGDRPGAALQLVLGDLLVEEVIAQRLDLLGHLGHVGGAAGLLHDRPGELPGVRKTGLGRFGE